MKNQSSVSRSYITPGKHRSFDRQLDKAKETDNFIKDKDIIHIRPISVTVLSVSIKVEIPHKKPKSRRRDVKIDPISPYLFFIAAEGHSCLSKSSSQS